MFVISESKPNYTGNYHLQKRTRSQHQIKSTKWFEMRAPKVLQPHIISFFYNNKLGKGTVKWPVSKDDTQNDQLRKEIPPKFRLSKVK